MFCWNRISARMLLFGPVDIFRFQLYVFFYVGTLSVFTLQVSRCQIYAECLRFAFDITELCK